MKLERPIIFFDIEGTGVDPNKDHIITLAAMKFTGELSPNSVPFSSTVMVKPPIPIPPESTEIHGITDADVATCSPFGKYAQQLLQFFEGSDLAGYGLLSYDVPLLWNEFYRAALEWKLDGISILDVANIFRKKEPRDLTAALKFYCGGFDHEEAHNAAADVLATVQVFHGQLASYEDLLAMPLAELAKFSHMEPRVDIAGVIVRNKDGHAVFNTHRNRGVKVVDDFGYANWMLRSDFSPNTKQVIAKLLSGKLV